MRQPHTSADDAVVPYLCISTQDCSTGIDDDTIADIRMPLNPLDESPILSDFKALCAKCDVLVQLNIAADCCCLPDHHACPMVDEEGIADNSAGVDVDPGQTRYRIWARR